jgi:hypothetical protein
MNQLFFHVAGGHVNDVPATRQLVDGCVLDLGLAQGDIAEIEGDELRGYRGLGEDDFAQASLSPRLETGLLLSFSSSTVGRVGPDRLALILFSLADGLEAYIGRTSGEAFTMAIRPDEIGSNGRLTGLHWFQYFSPELASRWIATTWDSFRTLHSRKGAVGLFVGDDPLARLEVAGVAATLGIGIRTARGRNPMTGEEMSVRHP